MRHQGERQQIQRGDAVTVLLEPDSKGIPMRQVHCGPAIAGADNDITEPWGKTMQDHNTAERHAFIRSTRRRSIGNTVFWWVFGATIFTFWFMMAAFVGPVVFG